MPAKFCLSLATYFQTTSAELNWSGKRRQWEGTSSLHAVFSFLAMLLNSDPNLWLLCVSVFVYHPGRLLATLELTINCFKRTILANNYRSAQEATVSGNVAITRNADRDAKHVTSKWWKTPSTETRQMSHTAQRLSAVCSKMTPAWLRITSVIITSNTAQMDTASVVTGRYNRTRCTLVHF